MSKLCVFLLIPVLLDPVFAITFLLPVNSSKCLREDIHKDVLVTGEYEVSAQPNTGAHLKITDSLGNTLYTKEDATKGKFSFVTDMHDQFEVCFMSRSPMGSGRVPQQLVKLNMKHGVEAKHYEDAEKMEKLTPLEAQLRRLEHISQSVADGYIFLQQRRKKMRQTNKSTNTQLQLFSIISICGFLALATWQIFYLRRFFKTKKLIE